MSNILENINVLIQETSMIRKLWLYGPFGILDQWLEKTFSKNIISSYENLMASIEDTIHSLEQIGGSVKEYVSMKDFEEILNRSLKKCSAGDCIVKTFFEGINTVIKSIITVYITLLKEDKGKITGISTFSDLCNFTPSNKSLQQIQSKLKQIQKNYKTAITSDEYGKIIALGQLNRAEVTSEMQITLTKDLDVYTRKQIERSIGGSTRFVTKI